MSLKGSDVWCKLQSLVEAAAERNTGNTAGLGNFKSQVVGNLVLLFKES